MQFARAAGAGEAADTLAPGTAQTLAVVMGQMEIAVAGHVHPLNADDAMLLEADVRRSHRTIASARAAIYMVMTYIAAIG